MQQPHTQQRVGTEVKMQQGERGQQLKDKRTRSALQILGHEKQRQTARALPGCPPGSVPDPDNGPGLEPQTYQGGISRMAPRKLAFPLQSLPPILHKRVQSSV